MENQTNDSILEELLFLRLDTALEEVLREDERCQRANKAISEQTRKLDAIGLHHTQWKAVDDALSAYNRYSWEYGRVAYLLGFQDAVRLSRELKNA